MCTAATEETSTWLMVDPWEALQTYQRTAVVLDHIDHEINTVRGGISTGIRREDGTEEKKNVQVMLLAGSDLIGTMSEPGVWSDEDVRHLSLLSPMFSAQELITFSLINSSTTSSGGTAPSLSSAPVPGWTKPRTAWPAGEVTYI